MTIEQTTQLIQLILNSVLMLGACGVMLCAAVMVQVMVEKRSRAMLTGAGGRANRALRHRLHVQHRQARRSVFWLSGACWLLGGSCGALVLRSIWDLNVLIPLSLGLFAIACGLFLIGVGSLVFSVMTSTVEPLHEFAKFETARQRVSKKTNSSKVIEFKGREMQRRS